jgi:hypothetical protein
MEKMTIMFGIVCASSQTSDVVGRNEMEKMTIMFGIVYTSSQTIYELDFIFNVDLWALMVINAQGLNHWDNAWAN